MSKIPSHVKYTKTIWLYAASRALERTAFYGMRSLLTIYMVRGALSLPESTSLNVYGWFVQGVIFAGLLGALLGDLVLGNRKAILFGGIAISLGLFLIAIPYLALFYTGLGFIILGCGLYTPNLMARFGKQFYDKPELTDGGFSVLYLSANVGGILGSFLISLVALDNFVLGFVLCGIIMVGSTLLSFLNKDTVSEESQPVFTTSPDKRALIIVATILSIGLYWYLYEVSNNGIYSLQNEIQIFDGWSAYYMWNILSSCFILPAGIAMALIYSFFYFRKSLKIAIGFIVSALGFALLSSISMPASDSVIVIITFSFLLLNLAEMIMAPVLYSVITQKTNPKYLALVLSLSFLPLTLLRLVLPTTFTQAYVDDAVILKVTTPIIALMGLIVLIVYLVTKKPKSTQ